MATANFCRTSDLAPATRPRRALGRPDAADGGAVGKAVHAAHPLTVVTSQTVTAGAGQSRTKVRRPLPGPAAAVIVDLARNFIVAHLARRLSAEDLVGATGVSESTLRRALHAQTGQTLSDFMVAIRLEQARAWLSSNRESRTQAEIAQALGFKTAAAFSRAYRRRFGETMSQTRTRAVKAAEGLSTPGKYSPVR